MLRPFGQLIQLTIKQRLCRCLTFSKRTKRATQGTVAKGREHKDEPGHTKRAVLIITKHD